MIVWDTFVCCVSCLQNVSSWKFLCRNSSVILSELFIGSVPMFVRVCGNNVTRLIELQVGWWGYNYKKKNTDRNCSAIVDLYDPNSITVRLIDVNMRLMTQTVCALPPPKQHCSISAHHLTITPVWLLYRKISIKSILVQNVLFFLFFLFDWITSNYITCTCAEMVIIVLSKNRYTTKSVCVELERHKWNVAIHRKTY